jgi:hypothetical protein
MSLQKTPKLFLIASLIGLFAAGGLIAWASPPEAADEVDIASPEPTGSGGKRGAAPAAVPAPTPRGSNPQVNFDVRLIGTAVVEGGPSIAFLQLTTGTRFVREGDEIVAGMRLVKVWRNRIDVERAGVHQEIRPGSIEEPRYEARSDSIRTEAARGDVDRLWETQGRTGRSLFYSHYRKPQNQ